MHIFQLDITFGELINVAVKVAYGDGDWHSNLKLP
jgi:hypothetical protein